MNKKIFDVFICYRRDKGKVIARNLQQALTALGLKVFFDMEELTDGKFNEKLYEAIEQSKNVIFLMTPGVLDRCSDEGDWVRIELEYVFDRGKNLIPVAPTGTPISFPDGLPAKLEPLKVLEISELNLEKLFKESVAKITERFRDVDVALAGYLNSKMIEETFLSMVRRFRKKDGIINADGRKALADSAAILGITPAWQLVLIERVEKEFAEKSAPVVPPNALPGTGTLDVAFSRYQVIVGKEVTVKDIEEAVGLDKISYDECYRGNLADCIEWAKANPDIYVMLRDLNTGHIVAYTNIMPVSDECYEKIRCGSFIDVEITPDMILSYDMPGAYCIYFSSVVIHPDYKGKVFNLLVNAILSRFLSLGSNEVFIKKMLADAVTPGGEKFCIQFGMSKVDTSQHGSTLYEVSLIPPKFRVASKMAKALHDYYQAKYDEEPYLFE